MKIVVNLTSVPFVLGLIVELEDCYIVTSNRESGAFLVQLFRVVT